MILLVGGVTEWHYHTEVTDYVVCLTGVICIELKVPSTSTTLQPGERFSIEPHIVHRVVNIGEVQAEYLLLQGVGRYDFCKGELASDT